MRTSHRPATQYRSAGPPKGAAADDGRRRLSAALHAVPSGKLHARGRAPPPRTWHHTEHESSAEIRHQKQHIQYIHQIIAKAFLENEKIAGKKIPTITEIPKKRFFFKYKIENTETQKLLKKSRNLEHKRSQKIKN